MLCYFYLNYFKLEILEKKIKENPRILENCATNQL